MFMKFDNASSDHGNFLPETLYKFSQSKEVKLVRYEEQQSGSSRN